ncbi:MAG: succinyldiaminopimelate transaminase, partial [Rhodocyclaceae bacterium]|nr:succinyldiaminopimelate transaminase [Rhodocyclaceae bacterium]
MNPRLDTLQTYPFQKLAALTAGIAERGDLPRVNLSIGEPRHATPPLIGEAIIAHLGALSSYPSTQGPVALRQAIADWAQRRYGLSPLDIGSQVIPVNGSREALFAVAQAVVTPPAEGADAANRPVVISPNPFYQIYEGAALLAGAEPYYLNTVAESGYVPDLASVPAEVWARTQLFYICSPGNPTGAVLDIDFWRELFSLADRHDFVIAADECYSEIYFDEAQPPLGALQAAQALGRGDYRNLLVFGSLSKRSNAPGLRSGYVIGQAALLKKFLLYRTYHGCAMSEAVAAASVAAWNDEAHVRENRALYKAKFDALLPILGPVTGVERPDAGFYLWLPTPVDDETFVKTLLAEENVLLVPGSYLARSAHGINPGANRVRIALVASLEECVE